MVFLIRHGSLPQDPGITFRTRGGGNEGGSSILKDPFSLKSLTAPDRVFMHHFSGAVTTVPGGISYSARMEEMMRLGL